jgi:hypothetical protein
MFMSREMWSLGLRELVTGNVPVRGMQRKLRCVDGFPTYYMQCSTGLISHSM